MRIMPTLQRIVRSNRTLALAVMAVTMLASTQPFAQDADSVPTRVGRLSDLSGQIYLAPQDHADDWSPVDLNYPVTSGDNLWASDNARAEVDFGGSQMRMSSATNVNVAYLDQGNLDLFVAQGQITIRFNAVDAGDSVVIDTPTTQIVLVQPGLYRIGVSPDQQQTSLTIRQGEATARVSAGLQQVLAGMTAVIDNDPTTVARFSNAGPQDAFDAWNADRDRYFDRSRSTAYVSPEMVGYADLANYGSWQAQTEYGNVWFPNDVPVGWAPYSDGYWTTVGGFGLTWVDRAPWGYAPFHYGRWAHVHGRWGWLPGNYVGRPAWAPALVAWTGGGLTISVGGGSRAYGWVPLGWREPYRPWWGGCSGGCWDRYNRPYRVDERDRDRYRDHAPPPDRYANWRVPGAVTAVSGDRLIARKPYTGGERVSLTGSSLASARPANSAPPLIKPSPNRIPTVRSGSRGTPRPASSFYATSKPAQMGLHSHAHGGHADGADNRRRPIPDTNAAASKPSRSNGAIPNNQGERSTPAEKPGHVQRSTSSPHGDTGIKPAVNDVAPATDVRKAPARGQGTAGRPNNEKAQPSRSTSQAPGTAGDSSRRVKSGASSQAPTAKSQDPHNKAPHTRAERDQTQSQEHDPRSQDAGKQHSQPPRPVKPSTAAPTVKPAPTATVAPKPTGNAGSARREDSHGGTSGERNAQEKKARENSHDKPDHKPEHDNDQQH